MDGEWWIDEEGEAHYADGDVGDINHENFVVVHCMHEVLDLFENSDNELLGMLARYLKQFIEDDGVDIVAVNEFVINWSDGLHREGKLNDDECNDIYAHIEEISELDKDLLDVVFNRDTDCRLYGIEVLGWARVAGNVIECWTAQSSVLIRISTGLYDIGDKEATYEKYTLEERGKSGVWYEGVPYWVFESGRVAALRPYRKYSGVQA
jgi:hypothetical protein